MSTALLLLFCYGVPVVLIGVGLLWFLVGNWVVGGLR